jgi:transposase InsO family protein
MPPPGPTGGAGPTPHGPTPYDGKIDGLTAEKILKQVLYKLKMDDEFEGRNSGSSWYDWSYQFQLKMTLSHLWPLYAGMVVRPTSGDVTMEAEFQQLSLMAFAVLNLSISKPIQQAIRAFREAPEAAKKAWDYMLSTYQSQDNTNRILLADQLARFKMKNNEDLEEYVNRLKAVQFQLAGVNTPMDETSFYVYLIKGLTSEWEYLRQYFDMQPAVTEDFVVHALVTAQRRKNADNARNYRSHQSLQLDQKKRQAGPKRFGGRGGKGANPGRGPPRDKSYLICYGCKQPGHPWTKCPSKKDGYKPTPADIQAAEAIRKMKLQQKGQSGSYVSPKGSHVPRALIASVEQCLMAPVGRREKGTWLIDSGCSIHMTYDRTAFSTLKPLMDPVDILVGNNGFIEATALGEVPLNTPHGPIILEEVLYVPELSSNLISYTKLMKRGFTLVTTPEGLTAYDPSGTTVLTAEEKGGMLRVHARQRKYKNKPTRKETRMAKRRDTVSRVWPKKPTKEIALAIQAGVSDPVSKASMDTWHTRLGHVNREYIRRTAKAAEGMEITSEHDAPKAADCVDCVKFKIRQQHFPPIPKSKQKSQMPLDLVHTDIAYALPETAHGDKYFLVLVDDYTRFTWAYPLTTRATEEVLPILQKWLNQVQNQCDRKLKALRADHAAEFTSRDAKAWAAEHGFRLEYSAPKASQQNEVAERAIGVLRAGAMSTLEQAELSPHFWPHALANHV